MAIRTPRALPGTAVLCALCLAAGCGEESAPSGARLLYSIEGFDLPESVRYDPDQDLYFVSNMAGLGSEKDGHGYISRIDAADPTRVEVFVRSGVGGATLDAPKGMELQGDTLWVADIDVVRGFHRRTGSPVGTVDFRPHGAVLLNDIGRGPDGSLYVTDTGIVMSNVGILYPGGGRVFSIGPGRQVSVVAQGPELRLPNGITWDSAGGRWLVVSFHPFESSAYALRAGSSSHPVLATGVGRWDGVEMLRDGRMLVTSWSDSSLHVIADGRQERVIRHLWQPADLGVDTRRMRVAIPLVLQGRVGLWELPER